MYHGDRIFNLSLSAVEQFRGQVERRVSGELSEDAFKSLRLMNVNHLQLHAYMLRVAIPMVRCHRASFASWPIRREYDRGADISPRARTFSTPVCRAFQICWPSLPKSRCTPFRLPAIASAM